MKRQTVMIRVNGNKEIGLGHVYRGIALAEMLKNNFEVRFLTRSDSMVSPIVQAGFNYNLIPDEIVLEHEPFFIKNSIFKDTILVLDGYSFDEMYQSKIKEFGFKLVFIDDLAKGVQKADLVINHSPGIKKTDYKTEKYTKLALGLEFALIRPIFIKNRKNVPRKNEVKNIFVSFGGSDPKDFTYKVVSELIRIVDLKKINVLIGSAYEHKSIFSIKSKKLNIHYNLNEQEVYNTMNSSDLAIVPASTTSIELAFLGIPMLLGYFVNNQIGVYQGFIENNMVIPLGDINKFNFNNLKYEINIFKKTDQRIINRIKSNPKDNIINLFKFNNFNIRLIEENDVEFIFNLNNELSVRKNSYNPKSIQIKDHEKWFQNQLSKNRSNFYILVDDGKPIGQVRFEMKKNHSIIGISISNKFRGNGFAYRGLTMAVKEFFKQNSVPIYAYIKKTNSVSVNLFKKVGFDFYKEEIVNGIDSVVYIFEIK